MSRNKSIFSSLLLVILAVSLVACGKKDDGTKAGTQVVAKVNGDEISIHQLNFQMSRLGKLTEEQSKAASRQVLERLVDQQLIMQKSIEAKLDRDPKVLQAVENAKREILAQAYLEQQMAGAKKPGEQEMNDFYAKHPELFEKRRVYRLQELAVAAGRDKLADIEAGARAAKSLDGIAAWLKSNNYQFSASGNVRAAEQLPMELLPRLNQMKDGEIVIIPGDKSINIVLLAASQEQPLTREKAAPMLEQYFLNKSRTEIAKQAVEKLHASAKIEYLGAFADMKADAKSNPAEAPKTEATPQAAQPESKPEAGKTKPDAEHINKGLSGL